MSRTRGMVREVATTQRAETRILVVINNNAGTPEIVYGGQRVSITDNGVGDYTLTLGQGASRPIQAIGSGYEANTAVAFGTRSNTAVQVLVTDLANAAKDADIAVELIVWDSSDDT